jgi:hypothetical protein
MASSMMVDSGAPAALQALARIIFQEDASQGRLSDPRPGHYLSHTCCGSGNFFLSLFLSQCDQIMLEHTAFLFPVMGNG